MKHSLWVRRLCAILVVVMIAALFTACGQTADSATKAIASSDSASADAAAKETPAAEPSAAPTAEVLSANEWLAENLPALQQSLLAGEFAKVAETLLSMQDELGNDAIYNALLYTAYVMNGELDKALELLFNKALNLEDFYEAVKPYVDEFGELKEALAAHMLKLSESTPEAYNTIVEFASMLENNDPTDPTVYAIRYIAALASGNDADLTEILQNAKDNGISAEALKTTALEYLEESGVTIVSVEQVEKGISTSTVYTDDGVALKEETTVTDGTYSYLYTKDPITGSTYSVVTMTADTGEIISKTQYIYELTLAEADDWGTAKEELLSRLEISYADGKPETITSYNAQDELESVTVLNSDGTVKSCVKYVNGVAQDLADEQIAHLSYTQDEKGNFTTMTAPVLDEAGNVIGYKVLTYDYLRPEGTLSEYKTYDLDNVPTKDITYEYDFNKDNTTGWVVRLNATVYEDGVAVQTVKADFESLTGEATFADHTATFTLDEDHNITEYKIKDLNGNLKYTDINTSNGSVFTKYDDKGRVTDILVYDSNEYILSMTVYEYDNDKDADKYTKTEVSYYPNSNNKKTTTVSHIDGQNSEMVIRVCEYDTNEYYTSNVLYDYEKNTKTEFSYYPNSNNLKKVEVYDISSTTPTLTSTYSYKYSKNDNYTITASNAEGKITSIAEYTSDDIMTSYTAYDAQELPVKSKTYDSDGMVTSTTTYEYTDGKLTRTCTYDGDNKLTSEEDVTYNSNGKPYTESVYSYTYDTDGNVTKTLETMSLHSYSSSYEMVYTVDGQYNILEMEFITTGQMDGIDVKNVSVYDSNYNILSTKAYRLDNNQLYAESETIYNGSVMVGEVDYYYDESGNVITEKTYSYDDNMKPLNGYDAEGNGIPDSYTTYEYMDGKQTSGTVYTCDNTGAAILTQKITYNYSEDGQLTGATTYDVDADGNAKYTDENGAPVAAQETVYTYDVDGNLTGSVCTTYDETGAKTGTVYYDADGNEIAEPVELAETEEPDEETVENEPADAAEIAEPSDESAEAENSESVEAVESEVPATEETPAEVESAGETTEKDAELIEKAANEQVEVDVTNEAAA